jgi:glyoxylase-like metal-dependent hydrolase (beta-lactamase superfamily II)
MTVDLGNKLVEVHHLGEGHTRGDAVAWLPNDKVLFAGDLVEYGATPYCGDAQLKHWRKTLQLLAEMKPQFLVPGRGDALTNAEECQQAIASTKSFVKTLFKTVKESVQRKESLDHCYKKVLERMTPKFGQWVIFEHCMPFNVSRAYDEASGIEHPRVWTAERDLEMWQSLNK